MKRKRELKDEELLIVASPDEEEYIKEDGSEDEDATPTDEKGSDDVTTDENASDENTSYAQERIKKEVAELREYFPAIKVEDIPDEVWDRVAEGDSLAAAYALFFIKRIRDNSKRISDVNAENKRKAPPKVKNSSDGELFFTPDTVRAMSADEIRKNYNTIISSMKKWK